MNNSKAPSILIFVVVAVLLIGGVVWAMGRNDANDDQANQQPTTTTETQMDQSEQTEPNIVELASSTPALSTLVSAVQAAELVETLQGEGPFTVFAPTNDAFAALPAGTLESLLKPENQDQLRSILTYHVVQGEVRAADLSNGQQVTTVQGGTLTVSIEGDSVYLVDAMNNRVMVAQADVKASNGVVHVISGVLMPQ